MQHKNYMRIENLFFQLLQVAIGTRNALDRQPTSKEWALLFDMGKKQALVSITMAGVTRLIHRQTQEQATSDYGNSIGMDEMTYLKWLA